MILPKLDKNEKPLDNLVSDGGFAAIFRTVACIGDSLASGEFEVVHENGEHSFHDMFEYSWGQFFSRMCGSTVYNFSRGGMTAKEYCETFADYSGFWNAKYAAQAYVIALGVNDRLGKAKETCPFGSLDDIDIANYKNNKQSFIGYYATIIQRYKQIQPRAKFFLMTMPKSDDNDEKRQEKLAHREFLYELAKMFDNTYVIDLYEYGPVYDKEFTDTYYLSGHLAPTGYLLTAKMLASYIDYIIRHNPQDFKEIGFIGTDLTNGI